MLNLMLLRLMRHQAFSKMSVITLLNVFQLSRPERLKLLTASSHPVQIQNSMQIGSSGSLQTASAMSAAASSAAMLAMSSYNLESAETSLARSHVTVERDTNAVRLLRNNYNKAVEKYGSGSSEAQLAASNNFRQLRMP